MSKEVFPKVASETTIKSCTKTKGGVSVKFNELNFTGSQFEQISDWIDDDVKVVVTLEQKQGNLYNTDNQADKPQQTADKELPKEQEVEYVIDKDSGLINNPSEITVSLPKLLNAECIIWFGCDEIGKYYFGYHIKAGRFELDVPVYINNPPYDSLKEMLEAVSEDICNLIDNQKYPKQAQLKTKIIKTLEAYI